MLSFWPLLYISEVNYAFYIATHYTACGADESKWFRPFSGVPVIEHKTWNVSESSEEKKKKVHFLEDTYFKTSKLRNRQCVVSWRSITEERISYKPCCSASWPKSKAYFTDRSTGVEKKKAQG